MPQKLDGGPAFPATETHEYFGEHGFQGMSLRDYFAAGALEDDIREYQDFNLDKHGNYAPSLSREQAKFAYADAMIKARGE